MTRTGPDRRPTLTLKGDEFTPEFRALVNKAAKRSGVTQAAFAAEAMAAAARRVLSGEGNPSDTPAHTPAPAGLAQMTALQAAIERAEERARAADDRAGRVERRIEDLATQMATLAAPRGVWARIRGR